MARTRTKSSCSKTSQFILSQSFKIGNFEIRYYGLTMLAAVLSAYLIGRKQVQKINVHAETFDDIAFWAIVWGYLGARLYYVLFYFSLFKNDLSEVFKIWHGGISIYGGLIFGTLALYWQCKKRNISFLKFADALIIGIPLAQAIGRVGNYLNYEAFGKPTGLPWGIFIPEKFRPEAFLNISHFHPTFLYEMIWNICVFGVLVYLNKKAKFYPGFMLFMYVCLYSFGRFWIEGLRLDSAYLFGFKIDQLVAIFLFLGSSGIMLYRYVTQARQ